MWMWENYTTLPHWLFYYRGEAGAPTITASSSQVWRGDDVCVGRNAKEKAKKTEEEDDMKEK